MGSGKWTRWGRGSCEGWSLELGDTIRCQVVRGLDRPGMPATWRAGSNLIEFGDFPTRDEAMDRIERDVRERMRRISEDWAAFQAQPKRPVR